jgi:hypothetical protein
VGKQSKQRAEKISLCWSASASGSCKVNGTGPSAIFAFYRLRPLFKCERVEATPISNAILTSVFAVFLTAVFPSEPDNFRHATSSWMVKRRL